MLTTAAIAATEATPVAAQHPAETWAAFTGGVTIIIGLVCLLYGRINKDIKDGSEQFQNFVNRFDDKLERGVNRFEEICKEITQINQRLKTLESDTKDHGCAILDDRRGIEHISRAMATLTATLEALRKDEEYGLQELDKAFNEIKNINNRLLMLETEHKRCQIVIQNVENNALSRTN